MSADPEGALPPQVTLLLIDVQKDFHSGGSLAIPGADDDANRIAHLIRTHGTSSIHRIVATMDSHAKLHIAHAGFWKHGIMTTPQTLSSPSPFTIITSDDVRNRIWIPRHDLTIPVSHWPDPNVFASSASSVITKKENEDGSSSSSSLDLEQYCIEYTTQLESKGRFQLCIWPDHCLIGSSGHGMVDTVLQAALEWSNATGRSIEWMMKGQNMLTEMYSALAAEVPITNDTAFSTDRLDHLLLANNNHGSSNNNNNNSRLLVCGQASSHCVNYTLRDIVAHWPFDHTKDDDDDKNNNNHTIIVLSDCMSPVPGFEDAAESFCTDMKQAGVKFMTSDDPNIFS
jgi:nicotinamidase/pyrazinamidase